MDNTILTQFLTYVQEQPKERTIDHSTYETCAIGDFSNNSGIDLDSVVIALCNTPIHDYLGIEPCLVLEAEVGTYGALAKHPEFTNSFPE